MSILGSLILYLITLAAMILALVCFLFFIHKDVDYSTFITSLVLWVISVLSVNIARDIILSKKKNKKEITARIIAPVVAMLTIAFFLLGPLFLVSVYLKIPFSGKLPSWGIYVLILGGSIGTVMGQLIYKLINMKIGGFSEGEIEKMWGGH